MNEILLPTAFLIPMACALGILLTGREESTSKSLAWVGFGAPFLIALYAFFNFEPAENGYAYLTQPLNTGLQDFGIGVADSESDQSADISEDGLPDRKRKLVHVLMGERKTKSVFSGLSEN